MFAPTWNGMIFLLEDFFYEVRPWTYGGERQNRAAPEGFRKSGLMLHEAGNHTAVGKVAANLCHSNFLRDRREGERV
jgi:hypothetical protein